MTSLWIDLPFLLGRLGDWKWTRHLAGASTPDHRLRRAASAPSPPGHARHAMQRPRLCLGIGDGRVRRQ